MTFTESAKAGDPFTITATSSCCRSLDPETILIYGCTNATIGRTLGEKAYPIVSYFIAERLTHCRVIHKIDIIKY